jgi:hypothetical protein
MWQSFDDRQPCPAIPTCSRANMHALGPINLNQHVGSRNAVLDRPRPNRAWIAWGGFFVSM